MSNIYAMAMDGLRIADEGRQRQKQSKLASLLGQAYQQPEQRDQFIGQAMAIDPQQAIAAQGSFGQMDDQKRATASRHAQVFMALPDDQKAQAYPQLAAEMRAITGVPIPETFDPKYLPMIQQIEGWQGGKQEMASHVINGRLVDNTGKVLYEAPTNGQLVSVPDGQGGSVQMLFDPSTGQLTQPKYGGAPQTAGPSGGASQVLGDAYRGAQLDPVKDFPAFASQFGAQITSTERDPRHNAEVGGVPNSYHLTGEAGDFVVPPQQRPAFIAAAQAKGYQAINEGDHVHLEPPHRGMTASQFGGQQPGARLGYTPPKPNGGKPAPNGYRWNAAGGLEVIPGGPAEVAQAARADAAAAKKAAQDAKAEQARQGQQQRQVEAASTAGDLVSAIDRLTQSPGFSSLGTAMGDIAISTPLIRSDAKDANEQLHTIAGQVALATMSRLKALSAQGATGFGALSEKELKLLQGAIATLQSDQISNKELKESLGVIKEKMQKVSDWKAPAGYSVGQIIEHGGKKYRITGLSDPNDPDVEEVR